MIEKWLQIGYNYKTMFDQTIKNTGPAPHRTIRDVLRDGAKQIIASLLFLVIGFLIMNWSAYYQILKNRFFTEDNTVLQQIVEQPSDTDPLATISLNKQIPPLDMEVTPTDNRLIIPRINQNLPIVRVSSENLVARDWNALEKDIQNALRDGVVHYPGTSLPGQSGNAVVTGHSSYFPWDSGRFKDVFALLHEVVVGDKLVAYYNQEKIVYEVTEIKVVLPDDIDVLKQTPEERLTLITCTPVGTNLKRLIVIAKPVGETSQKTSRF